MVEGNRRAKYSPKVRYQDLSCLFKDDVRDAIRARCFVWCELPDGRVDLSIGDELELECRFGVLRPVAVCSLPKDPQAG